MNSANATIEQQPLARAGVTSSRPFRLDIQGMRGLSVVCVILGHSFPKLLPGGFVGVDIFFVISGFVITQTILRDIELHRFSFRGFYERRIRRIFPMLFAVLLFVLCGAWFTVSPAGMVELSRTALAAVFFCSNVMFLLLSGYFDSLAGTQPLLHTWSLSIEEQFYLLYPLVLLGLRRISSRLMRVGLVLTALASLLVSEWAVHHHPSAAFYLAPSRAFELLLGAIVATGSGTSRFSVRSRNLISFIGLALLLYSIAFYSPNTPFPGFAAFLPSAGAALIIWSSATGDNALSAASKLLANPVAIWLGTISYSLYLWHWPILVFARRVMGESMGLSAILLSIFSAVCLSVLSFHLIEVPFSRRKWNLPYLKLAPAVMATFALVFAVVIAAAGFPGRFSQPAMRAFSAETNFNPDRLRCHDSLGAIIPYEQHCVFGKSGAAPDIAVWGDSHGAEFVVALGERLRQANRSAIELTASSCPPSIHYVAQGRPLCSIRNDDVLKGLLQDHGIKTVILVADLSEYDVESQSTNLYTGYRLAVEQLDAAGKRVVVVYPVPTYHFDVPELMGVRMQLNMPTADLGMTREVYERTNGPAIHFLDSLGSEIYARILPEDALCEQGYCRVTDPRGAVLYFNSNHLNVDGARLLMSKVSFKDGPLRK